MPRSAAYNGEDRYNFLLALIGYLQNRGSVSLAEAAKHFGLEQAYIRKAVRSINETNAQVHGFEEWFFMIDVDALDDEGEREPEDVDRRIVLAADALDRHQAVPDREQQAAEQHRFALAEIAVGEIAAEHRGDVDEAGIGPVDQRRLAVGEKPVLGQVEDQQRAHAVVGEALPHFGEEKHVQALGVAGELRILLDGDLAADGEEHDEEEDGNGGDLVAFLPEIHGLHAWQFP